MKSTPKGCQHFFILLLLAFFFFSLNNVNSFTTSNIFFAVVNAAFQFCHWPKSKAGILAPFELSINCVNSLLDFCNFQFSMNFLKLKLNICKYLPCLFKRPKFVVSGLLSLVKSLIFYLPTKILSIVFVSFKLNNNK